MIDWKNVWTEAAVFHLQVFFDGSLEEWRFIH
jgi:hypothetical protein